MTVRWVKRLKAHCRQGRAFFEGKQSEIVYKFYEHKVCNKNRPPSHFIIWDLGGTKREQMELTCLSPDNEKMIGNPSASTTNSTMLLELTMPTVAECIMNSLHTSTTTLAFPSGFGSREPLISVYDGAGTLVACDMRGVRRCCWDTMFKIAKVRKELRVYVYLQWQCRVRRP